MFSLKGCTPVRKPVNKDTGCEEGRGGRGLIRDSVSESGFMIVCSLSMPCNLHIYCTYCIKQ